MPVVWNVLSHTEKQQYPIPMLWLKSGLHNVIMLEASEHYQYAS